MLTETTTTRDAILHAAAEMLKQVGYASFSFRDLATTVGIRSASIHYHFPTKGDLGIALVKRFREEGDRHAAELAQAHPDVRLRLVALGQMFASNTCFDGKACPMNLLQAEFAVLPSELQQAVRAWVDDVVSALAAWLEEGRGKGQLRFPGSAAIQARVVWSVLEYGAQLARTNPNQPFLPVVQQMLDTMAP